MSGFKNRRTRIVINKPVQSRIVFSISWPALICMMLTGLTLTTFCVKLGYEATTLDVELPSVVPVCLSAITFMIVGCLFFMYLAVKFSHHIAGPMYRLQKTLETAQAGDLGVRANLRRGDHLGELAESLNRFLDWLQAHPPTGVELKTADAEPAATTAPEAVVPGEPASL